VNTADVGRSKAASYRIPLIVAVAAAIAGAVLVKRRAGSRRGTGRRHARPGDSAGFVSSALRSAGISLFAVAAEQIARRGVTHLMAQLGAAEPAEPAAANLQRSGEDSQRMRASAPV
jgi:hypothetical protein